MQWENESKEGNDGRGTGSELFLLTILMLVVLLT